MSFALWSPAYETGHSEVDHQHQRLFQMINELHEAMSHGRGREALARQVSELALRFSKGYLTIPNTLAQFLSTWLKHHIREEDMALIRWVNNRPE
jgi:hemerythrin